jgi:carbamate kinase
MRVVVALGGNAISRRGEAMTVDNQRRNLRQACVSLAQAADDHELVITHGNGPQVGLLALRDASYAETQGYPLDVIGAETQGMIGYFIEIELRNAMTHPHLLTTILTLVVVKRDDPAFAAPTKFVGPVYSPAEAERLQSERGWTFALDGDSPRRVVPSPVPQRLVQTDSVKTLLQAGHVVVSTGGGGIPVLVEDGMVVGIEAVVDKDASSAVLAASIEADVLVMATDISAVHLDWGTPQARPLTQITTAELAGYDFPAGSMGPKVDAAIRFVDGTGGRAMIGQLSDLDQLLGGTAGTTVLPS